MRVNSIALACCLCACVVPPTEPASAPVASAPAPTDLTAYANADSTEDLAKLLEHDLSLRDFTTAYEGLQRFMEANVLAGHETRASLLMQQLRPVWRFQTHGGHAYIGAIDQLQQILAHGAKQDLSRAYSAVERNDLDSLRRMRADPRSLFGDEVRGLSSELKPHVTFVDALLRFDDLRHASAPDANEAHAIVAQFDACAPTLERAGYAEIGFLARITAAQALDVAHLDQEALERWIAIGQSKQLHDADESVQVAVAGRIQSYRDRLRAEMEGRIHSEEAAKAQATIHEIETHYAQLSDEQKARIAALETELAQLSQRKDGEAVAALALQGAALGGTIEQQAQRVRELEQLLVAIAIESKRDWHEKNGELAAQGSDWVAMASDVVSVWQATRFRAKTELVAQ